jgi:hypothetical protein
MVSRSREAQAVFLIKQKLGHCKVLMAGMGNTSADLAEVGIGPGDPLLPDLSGVIALHMTRGSSPCSWGDSLPHFSAVRVGWFPIILTLLQLTEYLYCFKQRMASCYSQTHSWPLSHSSWGQLKASSDFSRDSFLGKFSKITVLRNSSYSRSWVYTSLSG